MDKYEENCSYLNKEQLIDNLNKIAYTLDKAYLPELDKSYAIIPFADYNEGERVNYIQNIRALLVKRWVHDRDEKISDCFQNVLSIFAHSQNTLALVIKRIPKETLMYFVVKNEFPFLNEDSKNNINLLADSLRGNFPGTQLEVYDGKWAGGFTEDCFEFDKVKSIATLTNIPSEKSEAAITQGIDKLLNGIAPKSDEENYTLLFLSESITQIDTRNILLGFEEMATSLSPFSGHQFQMGKNETNSHGETASLSNSISTSQSISKTHSVNAGINFGMNQGQTTTTGGSLSGSVGGGRSVGGRSVKATIGASVFRSVAKAMGINFGVNMGYGYSWGTVETDGKATTETTGNNSSILLGTSESSIYQYKSYAVSNTIDKLEKTIKRINESQATGLWKYGVYVLGQNSKTTKNVAHFLAALTSGNHSYVEPKVVQEWSYKRSHSPTIFDELQKYITHFCHPVFFSKVRSSAKDYILVTPTSNISTTELSQVVSFPHTSVQGLPIIQCARFGREAHSLIKMRNTLKLGHAYHMHTLQDSEIFINKKELTKHTFITGSTGSGKSNTVYTLLNKLCYGNDQQANFLVVEPAKGEYKEMFGGYDDVTVYGTNQLKFPNMLQINPFSFPDDIHVLEHIDRLVEVFNACWPMYAAMPAILKEAIEKSYEHEGWNLRTSKNPGAFPTFETLLDILPQVVESSGYSDNTSNDYKGALITRIRSLTRGFYGQIFGGDTPYEDLFNRNVIIDIHRIGSSETKALIMGILVLKLQEFRMSEGVMNSDLRHITVLEEAHNLLRRTSGEQSQESSNLQGKSVEMLANAIAEMRTYGEGFIIADQSPGLLDMSVIRNTNTKIILRLPDESDRMLVGKAAGLNDSQITELAKLKQGVAAISQSDWLEPVLCQIDEFEEARAMKVDPTNFQIVDEETQLLKKFINDVLEVERAEFSREEADMIRKWGKDFSLKSQQVIELALEGKTVKHTGKLLFIYNLLGKKADDIKTKVGLAELAKKKVIAGYDFTEKDTAIRVINDLILNYYPMMEAEPQRKVELHNHEVVK